MCLPGAKCVIAVARDGDAVAALPLCRTAEGFAPLGTWYSFFVVRPVCNDTDRAPALLAALARSMAPAGAARLTPMPEREAGALAAAFRASGWIGTLEPCDTNYILELNGRSFDAYWAARPGALRETAAAARAARGSSASASKPPSARPIGTLTEQSMRAAGSRRKATPHSCAPLRWQKPKRARLRMGVAEIDGEPVAAQFWTVEGGTAWIHELAHDEASRKRSPAPSCPPRCSAT